MFRAYRAQPQNWGMTMRKKKTPKTIQVVVDRLRDGQKLCRSLRMKDTGENEVCYFYEPGGRRCGRRTAEKAIDLGLLKPLGDSLFGPEDSQTWVAA